VMTKPQPRSWLTARRAAPKTLGSQNEALGRRRYLRWGVAYRNLPGRAAAYNLHAECPQNIHETCVHTGGLRAAICVTDQESVRRDDEDDRVAPDN
jgi:hypothetical protein